MTLFPLRIAAAEPAKWHAIDRGDLALFGRPQLLYPPSDGRMILLEELLPEGSADRVRAKPAFDWSGADQRQLDRAHMLRAKVHSNRSRCPYGE